MCKHYNFTLTENDRHFIDSLEDNNCVLCLVNRRGLMSQEDTGKYLGISKMRVSQIEKIAKKKLSFKIRFRE